MKNITVVSAVRRPEMYKNVVDSLESQIGDIITGYIVFNNSGALKQQFKDIFGSNSKVRVINAPDSYILRNGFDSVYNTLMNAASKDDYILMAFDTDTFEINKDEFYKDLEKDKDVYGFKMYMQRGDVWETKYQLFKNDDLLKWFGIVHENIVYNRQPDLLEITSLRVIHNNALDKSSKELKKTDNGFIILEPTEPGSDSDFRNMLYESLTWQIVNENGRHMHKNWFIEHYRINKELIDDYHNRAKEYYNAK